MTEESPPATGSDREVVELELAVPEMDCPTCAGKVDSALERVSGVLAMETRPTAGRVQVRFDPATTDRADVEAAVRRAGYTITGPGADAADAGDGAHGTALDGPTRNSVWRSRRAIKTGIGAVLLAAGLALEWTFPGLDIEVASVLGVSVSTSALLFLSAVAVSGQAIIRGGYYSARNRTLDIDFLMSAAILAAVTASVVGGISLYGEAATLAVLFSVSELLERHAMDRTRSSLDHLLELAPDMATVRRDGTEVSIPAEEVDVGDTVLVRPGDQLPVDGVVRAGESAVDESPITGESVPADKVPGDEVYAGSVVEGGYLEVEATSEAGASTLARVVDLVSDAESNQTEREQFVDRFAGYYTPLMVGVAVVVAVVPPLAFGAPWATWFVYGITMLVLACPCAFVISTPVSVVSGVTSAANHGVLVKGGDRLEAMGEVEAVAIDKTGTLTTGELGVTDVVPLGDHTEADVLRCARGLEARSEHPIGEAIVAHADKNGGGTTAASGDRAASGPEVTEFESLTGRGVRASLDGTPHLAGKPGLFADLDFDLEHVHTVDTDGLLSTELRDLCERQGCLNLVEDTIPRLQAEGKTVVLVGRETELEGIIAVADELRPEAPWTVEQLRERGLDVVMLTGDNERTARAIADRVGVDDVRAGLLPEEKVAAVEELRNEYGEVAMVGDGVNDAPALAAATVGVAMGAAGTDTAIETADIALLGDDISRMPYIHDLACTTNGVIRQNIYASLGAKALLAVGVPLGYVSVALAVLAGDAGMTLAVTGNAMRLSRVEPAEYDGDRAPDVSA